MQSVLAGGDAETMMVALCLAVLASACPRDPVPTTPQRTAPVTRGPPPSPLIRDASAPAVWPEPLARAMAGRGPPHAQPIALPADARGRSRWLTFIGPPEVALAAWHVAIAPDGSADLQPAPRWPAGVRVLGGVVESGVAYVLLESIGVLDQPGGLRGTWIDTEGPLSTFESSPMALADVRHTSELASRVKKPPVDHDASGLLTALRTASASTASLAGTLAIEGADLQIAWQSIFTQRVGHLRADDAASSPLSGLVLAILREALATQACGADACEAWTDGGRSVVRFDRLDGRWVVRTIIEDAPVTGPVSGGSPPRAVPSSDDVSETESFLRARAREVRRVLGQAPLTADGGTIGVGMTDLAPDVPVIVVREGAASRVFTIDAGAVHGEAGAARWEAAFADVDGDGRTDVVLRMSGAAAVRPPVAWNQAYLAPPPSVQTFAVEADLPSALVMMDAPDVGSAAHAAAAIAPHHVLHDEVCRLLAAANTPAGFRHEAAPDARLLHFDEPKMPTWRPKVVSLGKLGADDVRSIGGHCSELTCDATRPYCAWVGGSDSEHFWFDWREGRLEIVGAADYDGE